MRTHYCGLVSAALLDQTVTLCGWVNTRRDHGGVIFIDLRDREGIVQVVCNPTRQQVFAAAEKIRSEFVIRVTGKVIRREPALVNPKLKSGEIEVLCHELEILNPAVTPPFQLDEENLSETIRLTHRVIDLRRPQMQANLRLRYKVAMAVRKYPMAKASSTSRRPCSPSPRLRARAITWCLRAFTTACSLRCRSRRSYSSSC